MEGIVVVPGSVGLLFNLNVAGHANNTLVNNVGQNLVTSIKVKFGGEILQDTQRYDLLQTYNDFFLTEEEREDRLKQGISSLNIRKLHANAGDKVTSDAGEVVLASIHNTKYKVPLDHPVLNEHGVFYPKALPNHLQFELTFADIEQLLGDANNLFPGTNTLIILDDCAMSKEMKKHSNKLIELALSGRHKGLSV